MILYRNHPASQELWWRRPKHPTRVHSSGTGRPERRLRDANEVWRRAFGATISGSWIANGPAAANPMLVPHGIAAGSLASQENDPTTAIGAGGWSSVPAGIFVEDFGGVLSVCRGEACQVEDQWTPQWMARGDDLRLI